MELREREKGEVGRKEGFGKKKGMIGMKRELRGVGFVFGVKERSKG